jgi:hypothetical protein
MKEHDILDGMLQLDDKLLLENRFCRKRRKVTWVRWVLLIILLAIFAIGMISKYTVPEDKKPDFIIFRGYGSCED